MLPQETGPGLDRRRGMDRRANFQTGLEGRLGLWNLARWDTVSDPNILELVHKPDTTASEFV